MNRIPYAFHVLFLVTAFAAGAAGCNDVGDNSYVPGIAACGPDSSSPDSSSTVDATAEAVSDVSNDISLNPDNTTAGLDSTVSDTGNQAVVPPNMSVEDTGAIGTGGQGIGQQGMGQQDAGVEETGAEDSDAQDAGGQGSGTEDAGAEAGLEEAGGQDTSTDAGIDSTIGDSGSDAGETGAPETGGTDAGQDAADGGLVPCTTAGQTNCVQCQGNDKAPKADKTCTPTEALLVQYDIEKGHSTAPGPSPTSSCYTCLYMAGCIDDTDFPDNNHECEDPLSVGTEAECLGTISCIFSSDCAKIPKDESPCYCGDAGALTTCQGNPAPGPINGPCAATIAQANGYPVSDGTDNTVKLTDVTRAGGKAVELFLCGDNNSCTTLCQ